MGGRSGEREVSLRSGQNVLKALKRQELQAVAVNVGLDLGTELRHKKIDAAFVILHGKYGEDGTVQGLLEMMDIPYTGSGVLSSALAMNKIFSKKIFTGQKIPTPEYCWAGPHQDPKTAAHEAVDGLGLPLVIKPVDEGSSLGVSIAKNQEQAVKSFIQVHKKYGQAMAERFIQGMNVTVGILGCGVKARALPVLELMPKNEFYDYQAKYTGGMTEFHVPARLPGSIYAKVQQVTLQAHQALGCHGWSRVDAIVDRSGTVYVLEVNTTPGMTDLSDLPAEAKAEGMEYDQVVLEILDSARKRL
ncbi:D-alanine--D-alanine ligase [candidate division TA06 bacterium]|uniref:D-alanine--D-alanine ligase n=1 Tax=candidate division TA06 bacterium TaxID=2250710 RepID=A0A933IBB9_UNCT6|nr:D-alanine--D-alanine ligase [candidate division TA06 bacterium]